MNVRRIVLAVVTACALVSIVGAGGLTPRERAKIALSLTASGANTCDCGGDAARCTCGSTCECPVCAVSTSSASKPGPVEWALYLRQYDRAVSTGKPLLIWVGETCPTCEKQWSQYLHVRLSEFGGWPGQPQSEVGPEVIVSKPDGMGGMTIAGRLRGIPDLNQVTALADVTNVVGWHSTQRVAPVPSLTFLPAPAAPPAFFGFGGGMPMGGGIPMGGGGGGRGGC